MSASLRNPQIAAGMRAQFDLRRRCLKEGAKQIGWKVGFGAPAAKLKFGINAPLVAFLLDTGLLELGSVVHLGGWQKPVAEPEIAIYMGEDLPASADRETTRAAIAAIGPAIELVNIDGPIDNIETVLAGDIFQRHIILGPRDPARAGARLDGLASRVSLSGRDIPVPADLETNTGELIGIVSHVADVVDALGDRLRAGQFIICGSLTAPLPLQAGETGVDHTLEGVGTASVRFVA